MVKRSNNSERIGKVENAQIVLHPLSALSLVIAFLGIAVHWHRVSPTEPDNPQSARRAKERKDFNKFTGLVALFVAGGCALLAVIDRVEGNTFSLADICVLLLIAIVFFEGAGAEALGRGNKFLRVARNHTSSS